MEHDATRAQAERIGAAIAAIRGGATAPWFDLVDATARYSTIVRIHLPKENAGFFPMADMLLPAAVQADLLVRFEAIDRTLPMTFKEAAASLQRKLAKPAPVAAWAAPPRFADRFLLYDERLAAAMAMLGDDVRRS